MHHVEKGLKDALLGLLLYLVYSVVQVIYYTKLILKIYERYRPVRLHFTEVRCVPRQQAGASWIIQTVRAGKWIIKTYKKHSVCWHFIALNVEIAKRRDTPTRERNVLHCSYYNHSKFRTPTVISITNFPGSLNRYLIQSKLVVNDNYFTPL